MNTMLFYFGSKRDLAWFGGTDALDRAYQQRPTCSMAFGTYVEDRPPRAIFVV